MEIFLKSHGISFWEKLINPEGGGGGVKREEENQEEKEEGEKLPTCVMTSCML
jgi:hypothetical protein